MKVDKTGFPHGVRCSECRNEIPNGSTYAAKLDAMIGDTPIEMIVCEVCFYE